MRSDFLVLALDGPADAVEMHGSALSFDVSLDPLVAILDIDTLVRTVERCHIAEGMVLRERFLCVGVALGERRPRSYGESFNLRADLTKLICFRFRQQVAGVSGTGLVDARRWPLPTLEGL